MLKALPVLALTMSATMAAAEPASIDAYMSQPRHTADEIVHSEHQRQGAVNGGDGFVFVCGAVGEGHAHAAEPELRDDETLSAELARFHHSFN